MPIEKLSAKISRRALLRGTATGAAGLGAMAMVGCGGGTTAAKTPVPSPAAGAPTQAAASPTAAPTKAAWTRVQLAAAPGPRRDHSLTLNADDGLIYLFGGRASGVANNELWTFDPATDRVAPDIRNRRASGAALRPQCVLRPRANASGRRAWRG